MAIPINTLKDKNRIMGYQPRPKARTNRGFERSKSARSKTKLKKPRLNKKYLEEQTFPSHKEIVIRTINSLNNLGNQIFVLAPFYEHFDRWIMNLQNVLTDFQSCQAVTVDEKFRAECSQICSNIESTLTEKKLIEESRVETIRNLLSIKNKFSQIDTLSQIEQKHIDKMKNVIERKNYAIKLLTDKTEELQEELDSVLHMKTGFFRGISKKIKAQKEEEITQRLNSVKKDIEEVVRSFTVEEVSLREEFERAKLEIHERDSDNKTEIIRLEKALQIDDSAVVRRIACNTLIDIINALLNRTESVTENAGNST